MCARVEVNRTCILNICGHSELDVVALRDSEGDWKQYDENLGHGSTLFRGK